MLCKVTAKTSIVVFFNLAFTPSGLSSCKCKCGIKLSNANKKTIPNKNPTDAGTHAIFPCSSDISIAGKISDQIEAAIITPDAKPKSNFSINLFILFLIKNTIAEPRVVPANGINNPNVKSIYFISFFIYLFYFFISHFIFFVNSYMKSISYFL